MAQKATPPAANVIGKLSIVQMAQKNGGLQGIFGGVLSIVQMAQKKHHQITKFVFAVIHRVDGLENHCYQHLIGCDVICHVNGLDVEIVLNI